jgi:hypothetical protein
VNDKEEQERTEARRQAGLEAAAKLRESRRRLVFWADREFHTGLGLDCETDGCSHEAESFILARDGYSGPGATYGLKPLCRQCSLIYFNTIPLKAEFKKDNEDFVCPVKVKDPGPGKFCLVCQNRGHNPETEVATREEPEPEPKGYAPYEVPRHWTDWHRRSTGPRCVYHLRRESRAIVLTRRGTTVGVEALCDDCLESYVKEGAR